MKVRKENNPWIEDDVLVIPNVETRDLYWMELDRIRQPGKFLAFLDHMMDKRWFNNRMLWLVIALANREGITEFDHPF